MQLSITHKFAFLANPKCGSTSIEKAIRKLCEIRFSGHPSVKHITASKFERNIRPLLSKVDPGREIETFCIMREPFEHLRSWYNYRRRAEIADPSHRSHQRYTGNQSFVEFIEDLLASRRGATRGNGPQAGFVMSADGAIAVDRIFRLDQMDQVADYLSSKIGRRVEIPVANRSGDPRSNESQDWSSLPSGLRDQLKERLATDYAIFHMLPWQAADGREIASIKQ